MACEVDVPLLVRFPLEQEGDVETQSEDEAQTENVILPGNADNEEILVIPAGQTDARESEPGPGEYSTALPLQLERQEV